MDFGRGKKWAGVFYGRSVFVENGEVRGVANKSGKGNFFFYYTTALVIIYRSEQFPVSTLSVSLLYLISFDIMRIPDPESNTYSGKIGPLILGCLG